MNSTSNYLKVQGRKWKDFKITIIVKEVNNQWLVDECGVINIPEDKQAIK